MGWDVVQIGLRHNLPVHDPIATAKEVAKRMKKNIRLVYRNEYEYDKEKNVVSEVSDYELIELAKFEVNNSNDCLQMTVSDYQAHQILESVGIDKLRLATFEGEFAEVLRFGDDVPRVIGIFGLGEAHDVADVLGGGFVVLGGFPLDGDASVRDLDDFQVLVQDGRGDVVLICHIAVV